MADTIYEALGGDAGVRALVDRFYEHLRSFEELQPLLSNDNTVRRLASFQKDYLVSLTGGEYGAEYVQERLAIGP